jgi:hypothetical protein
MWIVEKIKSFYKKSGENRTQFYQVVGTFVIPLIFLAIIYIVVMIYFPSKTL